MQTILDVKENIAAMYIAIVKEDAVTPEQAFAALEGRELLKVYDHEDILDMLSLRIQGLTYKEIGEIYGLTKDNIYGKLRRFNNKKDLPSDNLERSIR